MLVHARAYSTIRRQSVFKVLKNSEEFEGIRMNLDEFRKFYKNFAKTSRRLRSIELPVLELPVPPVDLALGAIIYE